MLKNMKKIYKAKFVVLLISSLSFNTSAQNSLGCSGSGYNSGNTWNPTITQVKIPSATFGNFTLPNTNVSNPNIYRNVIGDFNGDGVDDLLMAYLDNSTVPSGTRLKMFTSNGNGDFTNIWTSQLDLHSVSVPSNPGYNVLPLGEIGRLQFIVGNFIGDNKDEILVYQKLYNSSQSSFFTLLSNLHSNVCIREFVQYYNPPYTTDPKIGQASLNGATFYATNLIGDSHDELFSLEPQSAGLPMKWFVQQVIPSGIVTGTSGTFGFSNEELYFENFDLTTSYDELFTLNKYSKWALLQGYNGSSFYYKWSDMGNGSFFGNNQCWDNYHVNFTPNSQVLFGNLDNCDDNIECVIFNNNDLEHPITLEFNSSQNQFKCESVLWPTMAGSNNVNTTQSQLAVTVNEKYTTPTTCANYLWNSNICLQWTGGNTIMTPRQFYSRVEKDGLLSILMGNFYNNTTQNGFVRKTKEILVFRNNYVQSVPTNLNALAWFTTDCAPNGMYGGGCDNNTNISFYNTLGQVVATYNKPNNSFNNYGYKGGANYSMYSLTNGNQNLKLGGVINSSSSIEITSKLVEITVAPNPADEAIEVSLNSLENIYETEISIINEKGEVTIIDKIDILEGVNKLTINVSHLTSGFYLIRASNKENVFTKKFIKN